MIASWPQLARQAMLAALVELVELARLVEAVVREELLAFVIQMRAPFLGLAAVAEVLADDLRWGRSANRPL